MAIPTRDITVILISLGNTIKIDFLKLATRSTALFSTEQEK
jgi:hypothetical protein